MGSEIFFPVWQREVGDKKSGGCEWNKRNNTLQRERFTVAVAPHPTPCLPHSAVNHSCIHFPSPSFPAATHTAPGDEPPARPGFSPSKVIRVISHFLTSLCDSVNNRSTHEMPPRDKLVESPTPRKAVRPKLMVRGLFRGTVSQ